MTANERLIRGVRWSCLGLLFLLVASLRHHLLWGERGPYPELLRRSLDAVETLCLVAFTVLSARAWLIGARAAGEARLPPRFVLGMSLPILLLAVAVPPFLSLDAVNYVLRGRIAGIHWSNPYVALARDFPGDAMMQFGDPGWLAFPLPYGPLLADLQAVVALVAEAAWFLPPLLRLMVGVALFKVLFLLCHVATAFAARRIAEVIAPERREALFVLVLWNPLLLLESVVNAHNDALATALTTLALAALVASREQRATVLLGLAACAKFVPAAVGPLALVHALRTRGRAALRPLLVGAGAVLALLVVWGLRYWRAPGALDFLARQSELGFSRWPWTWLASEGVSVGATLTVLRVLAVAAIGAGALALWRSSTPQRLCAAVAVALLALAVGGSSQFAPWYHVWWLPYALLFGRGWLLRAAIAVTCCAPLSYVVWTGLRRLDTPHIATQLLLALLVPLLAAIPRWRART
jgi:hypothetical protein